MITEVMWTKRTLPGLLSVRRSPSIPQPIRTRLINGEVISTPFSLKQNGVWIGQRFTSASGKSLALPLQAVFSNNDENTVTASESAGKTRKPAVETENYTFISQNGKAERRVVTLGHCGSLDRPGFVGVHQNSLTIQAYAPLKETLQGVQNMLSLNDFDTVLPHLEGISHVSTRIRLMPFDTNNVSTPQGCILRH